MSSRYVLFRASRQLEYQLRNDLFEHLQRLPQSYFAQQRTGDLMSRAVNDVNNVRMFLGMGLQNLLQTPILFAGALIVMCWVNWQLALLFLLPYPIFIAIARFFGRRIHIASLAVQEQLGEVSTVAQENASGVFVVRYHLELILAMPLVAGFFAYRIGQAFEDCRHSDFSFTFGFIHSR